LLYRARLAEDRLRALDREFAVLKRSSLNGAVIGERDLKASALVTQQVSSTGGQTAGAAKPGVGDLLDTVFCLADSCS